MKLEEQIQRQRAFFQTNQTKALGFRKKQLQQLRRSILHHEEALYAALKADLNKSKQEAFLTEIGIVLGEISNAIRNLEKWARPVKKRTPRSTFPGKSQVFKEPYGVVLILSPWNYPFQLAFAPLVGALAAGNCAVVKTSGSSVHTGKVMEAILKEAFTPEQVLCLGQEARHQEILAQKYDYIFFTGSGRVGRTVMEAASKHLTPLSLELGGKSPCFVHSTADLDLAAKRIAWGKFLNGGQTCVAPNYLLVDKEIKAELIEKLKVQI
ncbi:MAG: aldehyde dehydrogenase family protein, partial [Anaerovoracaceae bacterium]